MSFVMRKPWIWSYLVAVLIFGISAFLTGFSGAISLADAALTFAAFSVVVGLGQMLVITLGPSNIDLSVPATITLSGTLALKFMQGDAGLIWGGVAISLAIGLAVGMANYLLIVLARIPPIIATLSSSFIIQSVAIWSNRGLRIKPPTQLSDFATGATFGLPNLAWVALILSAAVWWMLERSRYGRWISAIGQNAFAARMAGVAVDGVRLATYLICAVMAAICGFLLASFSGGAALNMGTEYMLMSIAVVVIGGSAVAGGNSNVPGIIGAALFMFLLVSMLNAFGLGAGVRLVMTGLIIIAVIILASRPTAAR